MPTTPLQELRQETVVRAIVEAIVRAIVQTVVQAIVPTTFRAIKAAATAADLSKLNF